jgi:hypothetical protein
MEDLNIYDFDFYISLNNRLIIPEYNIDYLFSTSESELPSMPESSENTVKVAGKDGDIVLSTTYEPMNFNLVCYTDDNLSQEEKDIEENKIDRFLNSIKNTTKTFALEKDNKYYDVKYSGALTTTNYPKHLMFSIPLKSSVSYAKKITPKKIEGNGSLESDTIKETGAIFTIIGPAINPIISLNDYSMEYNNSLLEGQKIIIDTNKSTITHINSDDIKANAMKYYNHQFPKIENGKNTLKVLSGINDEKQVTVEWYDLTL